MPRRRAAAARAERPLGAQRGSRPVRALDLAALAGEFPRCHRESHGPRAPTIVSKTRAPSRRRFERWTTPSPEPPEHRHEESADLLALCGALVPALLAARARARRDVPDGVADDVADVLPTGLPTALPTIPGLTLPNFTNLPADARAARGVGDARARSARSRRAHRAPAVSRGVARAKASRSSSIPAEEINAYAGCDAHAPPVPRGTEGLLHAIFAIAETKACDEIDGAHSYEAYMTAIVPVLTAQTPGSPQLPRNVLPGAVRDRPARAVTRARELRRHRRVHLRARARAPLPRAHRVRDQRLAVHAGPRDRRAPEPALIPAFNQPNELAADSAGLYNVMDTGPRAQAALPMDGAGRAACCSTSSRVSREAAAAQSRSRGRTRPRPSREGWVRTAATTWRFLHP